MSPSFLIVVVYFHRPDVLPTDQQTRTVYER